MIDRYLYTAIAFLVIMVLVRNFQAYVALALGDDTPQRDGAISLNPSNHIDLIGYLLFVFVGIGWTKPLYVNKNRFKNKFWGTIIFSLSHLFMSLLIAIIFSVIYLTFVGKGYDNELLRFCLTMVGLSIAFGVINFLPFPPFYGAMFISAFLPSDVEYEYNKLSKYTTYILMFLILTRTINYVLEPLRNIGVEIVLRVSYFIVKLWI